LLRDVGSADALGFVNTDDALRLCDGMAQTTKHHTRQGKDRITARIKSITSVPGGERVKIGWSSPSVPGGIEDALDLARRCVGAWQRFLQQHGLDPMI
jgi:hypothetical protein